MTVKVKTKPTVSYSSSCFKHSFRTDGISLDFKNKLMKKIIVLAQAGNFELKTYQDSIVWIEYVTDDDYETSTQFAKDMASNLAEVISNLN
jgi:hypothetical protein